MLVFEVLALAAVAFSQRKYLSNSSTTCRGSGRRYASLAIAITKGIYNRWREQKAVQHGGIFVWDKVHFVTGVPR